MIVSFTSTEKYKSEKAAEVAVKTPTKSPKKKAPAKPKKPAAHPKYSEMVGKAIAALKERGGSSRQAILKYILANFNVGNDAKTVNNHLKLALKAGVKNKSLKQSKGTGASGSFKIGEVAKPVKKKPTKVKKAVKPKAAKPKKAKTPKKTTTKKTTATKKATGEKKEAKPKAKKPATKKPAAKKATKSPKKTKTATKPKKAKTPKKK